MEEDWHETASAQISWQGEVLCVSFGWEESVDSNFFMEMDDRRFEVQERKGKSGWWTMEDWQFIDPDRFRLPQEGDIPIDQAIQWAGEALIREQGMRSEDLNSRMPAVHIEKYPGLGATIQYKYVVYFTPKDSSNGQFDNYADLDAETGKILRTYWRGRGSAENAEQIQDGVNGFHTIEEIQSAKGENIDDWTLQERAYFLPDHGLPDERYISESTAVRIAKRAWSAIQPERDEERVRVVSWFITNEEKYDMPYWEIRFLDKENGALLWDGHVLADKNLLNNMDDPYGMPEPK